MWLHLNPWNDSVWKQNEPPKLQVLLHPILKPWPRGYQRGFPHAETRWTFKLIFPLHGKAGERQILPMKNKKPHQTNQGFRGCHADHTLCLCSDKHGIWLPAEASESFYLPRNTRDQVNFKKGRKKRHFPPPPAISLLQQGSGVLSFSVASSVPKKCHFSPPTFFSPLLSLFSIPSPIPYANLWKSNGACSQPEIIKKRY